MFKIFCKSEARNHSNDGESNISSPNYEYIPVQKLKGLVLKVGDVPLICNCPRNLIVFVLCSDENLIKDTYLRQKMDEQGWVPISLIAGFKKVETGNYFWFVKIR